ncbi:MAG: hypothetical protein C0474_00180 [Sphingobium sp.]|nr:hypothetical protein [Sphingobium sp.]
MRAKRIDPANVPIANRAPPSAFGPGASAVASGGVVADWQREIELRLAAYPPIDQLSRGEVLLRQASRALGWSALLFGYGIGGFALATRLF